MAEKRKYLKFIAYLQIIGIFLVVVGHSFHEYPDGNYGRSMLLYRMMHSFRMPLFMFVSGFLMVYTTGCAAAGYGRFVRGKLQRLLLPFAVLTLVTFVPRSLLSSMADEPVPLTAAALGRAFVYPQQMVIPYLWFLQASFTLLVLCFALLAVSSRLRLRAAVVDIALIAAAALYAGPSLPQAFSLYYVGKLGIYFVLGIVYARNYGRIDALSPGRAARPAVAVALWVLWALLFFAFEGTVWMPLCSVAGIAACISIAKILDEHDIRVLDPFFGANYIIFLLSWYFNILSQQVLAHFVELPWQLHTALSLASGIVVPWLIFRYMQRHPGSLPVRVAARLLGQSLRKR